jgi:hypothetical protein
MLENFFDLADIQEIRNCSPIRMIMARMPSTKETVLWSKTVARMDPSATVTTRSKAFSLDRVLFPEMRRKATSARYAITPTSKVLPRTSQELKRITEFSVKRRLYIIYSNRRRGRLGEPKQFCSSWGR